MGAFKVTQKICYNFCSRRENSIFSASKQPPKSLFMFVLLFSVRSTETWVEKPCYGKPLEEHLALSGRDIAFPIEACVTMLLECGMQEEVRLHNKHSASVSTAFYTTRSKQIKQKSPLR